MSIPKYQLEEVKRHGFKGEALLLGSERKLWKCIENNRLDSVLGLLKHADVAIDVVFESLLLCQSGLLTEYLAYIASHIDEITALPGGAMLRSTQDIVNVSRSGVRPIHVAATMPLLAPLRILVEHGADVTFADDFGQTAMHRAAQEGSVEIMRFLLEQGGRLDLVDDFDWNARDYLAEKLNVNPRMVWKILKSAA